ncbi:hypothetical protein NMG60_11013303 [Bertholletia excelsa]
MHVCIQILSVTIFRISLPVVSDLPMEMGEELLKRNTDCVYFLASPLTCKKGIECEYRHCEIARLNPRDCWYWLSGSCLNPSCAFRHPPLDAHKELSSETAPPQYQCSEPVNKVNVPCYFYFNGFCNKGDRCSYLHGPEDGVPAWKSLKTASAVSDVPSLEKKTYAGHDLGSASVENHPYPYEAATKILKDTETEPKENLCLSTLGSVKDQSNSHVSASEREEAAAIRSGKVLVGKGLIESGSFLYTEQSSDEPADGHTEQEDWLESSPGFDVLVDNRLDKLELEHDPKYLVAIDGEGKELNGYLFGYDYDDSVDYDPAYADVGISYEQDRLDSYDQFDNGQKYDYVRKYPKRSREEVLDPDLPQKRKFIPVDLRDHLRKRRIFNGRQVICFSRRSNFAYQIDQSREFSINHGIRQLPRRLTTGGDRLNSKNAPGWFRHSRSTRSSKFRFKEKWQSRRRFHSPDVSRKPVSRKKPAIDPATFSGPKTLAQIKEEKRKSSENGNASGQLGHSSGAILEEFQGPKPLSEILKEKKKLGSVVCTHTASS